MRGEGRGGGKERKGGWREGRRGVEEGGEEGGEERGEGGGEGRREGRREEALIDTTVSFYTFPCQRKQDKMSCCKNRQCVLCGCKLRDRETRTTDRQTRRKTDRQTDRQILIHLRWHTTPASSA